MILYRPTGLEELGAMYEAEMRAFPPRLPEQPIFYPVLVQEYAERIARQWNTKVGSRAGFVTRFEVDDAYASTFDPQRVGDRDAMELWVPAAELTKFNSHIMGRVEVIATFFGEPYSGVFANELELSGADAKAQFVRLAGMLKSNLSGFAGEIEANDTAVFLNFFFWEQHDFAADGFGFAVRDAVLSEVRKQRWTSGRGAIPLGVEAELPIRWNLAMLDLERHAKLSPEEVRLVSVSAFHDGVLSGTLTYADRLRWFEYCGTSDNGRRYVVFELSDAEIVEEERWNTLFAEHVGDHGEPRADGEPRGTVKPFEEHAKFYEPYSKRAPQDYSGNRILGWFEGT